MPVLCVLGLQDSDVPVPFDTDYQTVSLQTSLSDSRQGSERTGRVYHLKTATRVRGRLPSMEASLGTATLQAHLAEIMDDAVLPQAAALGDALRGLLPAVPVHISAACVQGYAKL